MACSGSQVEVAITVFSEEQPGFELGFCWAQEVFAAWNLDTTKAGLTMKKTSLCSCDSSANRICLPRGEYTGTAHHQLFRLVEARRRQRSLRTLGRRRNAH